MYNEVHSYGHIYIHVDEYSRETNIHVDEYSRGRIFTWDTFTILKRLSWVLESEQFFTESFRGSKMAAGGHFVKKMLNIELRVDVKCREMRSNVIFGYPKQPLAVIL